MPGSVQYLRYDWLVLAGQVTCFRHRSDVTGALLNCPNLSLYHLWFHSLAAIDKYSYLIGRDITYTGIYTNWT